MLTPAISGGFDKTVRLWEAASGTEVRVLRGHEGAHVGPLIAAGSAPNPRSVKRTLNVLRLTAELFPKKVERLHHGWPTWFQCTGRRA